MFYYNGPYPENPPKPEELRFSIVHKADKSFPFLHDTMNYFFQHRLFMAWYNSSSGEIKGKTIVRGRYSDDCGTSWSEPFVIMQSKTNNGLHYVPVNFYEYNQNLFANITIMKKHDTPIGYITMKYERDTKWIQVGSYNALALFNTNAKILPDGRLVCGSRISPKVGKKPEIPCIAIAHEFDGNLEWNFLPISAGQNSFILPLQFPETDFILNNHEIHAIIRNDRGYPLSFCSKNNGITWESHGSIDMPVTNSKMCCGTLSNGCNYFIYNENSKPNKLARSDSPPRSRLVMAVSHPGDTGFSRLYTIADGTKDHFAGGTSIHYPCATEYEGHLYLSCTLSQGLAKIRHAILFIIPIASICMNDKGS